MEQEYKLQSFEQRPGHLQCMHTMRLDQAEVFKKGFPSLIGQARENFPRAEADDVFHAIVLSFSN